MGVGQWPAIIDEETAEKLDAVLLDPARRKNHVGNAPTRYLASVLTCTCGEPMYSRTRKRADGSTSRFYTCKRSTPGQTHVSIGVEVDEVIERVILARMTKPDALEVIRKALAPQDDDLSRKMQDLFGQRAALLSRLEALDASVVDGDVDVLTFGRLETKIREQLASIDARLQEMTETMGADPLATELTEDVEFAQWWEGASIEDKRRLTNLLMEIRVFPGKPGAKKFDPKRVQVVWKS